MDAALMRRGTALATGAATADGYEADVTLINMGEDTVTLPGTVAVSEECALTTGRTQIPPRRTAVVTLTIGQQCFAGDIDELQAELAPSMPAVRIAAPQSAELTSWAPLGWGMFVGLLCAIVVGLIGRDRFVTKNPVLVPTPGPDGSRPPAYTEITDSIDAKFVELGATEPTWKGLEPTRPGSATPLRGLDATWSLEDSVVSTATVGTTGLIALLGSSDLLTALLGSEPSTTITVMTVAAILNAGLIALAVGLVRLVSPDGVSVLAAILGTSLVTVSGVSQAVAIGVAAATLLGAYPLLIVLALAVTLLVVALVVALVVGRRMADHDRVGQVPPGSATPHAVRELDHLTDHDAHRDGGGPTSDHHRWRTGSAAAPPRDASLTRSGAHPCALAPVRSVAAKSSPTNRSGSPDWLATA